MSFLPKRQSRNRAQGKRAQAHGRATLRSSRGRARAYLEFELGPEDLQALQDLAQAKGCTVFEMGIRLLEEGLYRYDG